MKYGLKINLLLVRIRGAIYEIGAIVIVPYFFVIYQHGGNMSEAQERMFYEQGSVKVTNARFVVPSQTYAMSGITSVRFFTEKPSQLIPIGVFLIALVALMNNGNIWSIIIPIFIGILLLQRKATHHVVHSSASGETRALASKNKEFIGSVINALNEAIVSRG